ncbi:MAG: hypothetical protein U0P46_06755 [Holophagaceae bacterium]
MTLRALLLLLACTLLPAAPKAMWVWEAEALRLLDDRAYETRVVGLLRQHGFSTLFLYADDYRGRNPVLNERGAYRGLLARLHRAGFRVEALLGSYPMKTWEYVLPERDQAARAMMQHILDYNAAAGPQERFDGVHLDIEPHALDSWNEGTRAGLSRMFLARSREWVAMARQAGKGFLVGAAIPFWYDGFAVAWEGETRPLNAHLQDLYDYVAVMDYRNRAEGPDGIIAHAREEIAQGAARGKSVLVGLETGEAQPAKVTFRHQGVAALAREMALAEQAFARQKAFGGFAIHHLGSWLELIEAPSSAAAAPGRP